MTFTDQKSDFVGLASHLATRLNGVDSIGAGLVLVLTDGVVNERQGLTEQLKLL